MDVEALLQGARRLPIPFTIHVGKNTTGRTPRYRPVGSPAHIVGKLRAQPLPRRVRPRIGTCVHDQSEQRQKAPFKHKEEGSQDGKLPREHAQHKARGKSGHGGSRCRQHATQIKILHMPYVVDERGDERGEALRAPPGRIFGRDGREKPHAQIRGHAKDQVVGKEAADIAGKRLCKREQLDAGDGNHHLKERGGRVGGLRDEAPRAQHEEHRADGCGRAKCGAGGEAAGKAPEVGAHPPVLFTRGHAHHRPSRARRRRGSAADGRHRTARRRCRRPPRGPRRARGRGPCRPANAACGWKRPRDAPP